ncbi:putative reverse transcriptase domain-containing protein [Tanacetum coccineum]
MGVNVVEIMEIGHMGEHLCWGQRRLARNLNIVTGTFTLNNHYVTAVFDSGADCHFVSTAFTPLLGIETNNLGFSYEIEIASGQLVQINKLIRSCTLEIEGYTFDIDLIPFGSESFDEIVGMDWLSKHKAKIICHKKVWIYHKKDKNKAKTDKTEHENEKSAENQSRRCIHP